LSSSQVQIVAPGLKREFMAGTIERIAFSNSWQELRRGEKGPAFSRRAEDKQGMEEEGQRFKA
jgi:hypothetical protein